ncbi:epoxide hydrolase, partial [Rhizobium ruizarguesonis]
WSPAQRPERCSKLGGEELRLLPGGDWGSPVSGAMARLAQQGLLGIHINLPDVVPPEVAAVLAAGGPAPQRLSTEERAA